jgi:hypothetical protein
MIYTVYNTSKAGKPVDYILDGYGDRIEGRSVECNTETGEVTQYRTNENGVPILHSSGNFCVKRRMIFQKPLQVVFLDRLTSPGQ